MKHHYLNLQKKQLPNSLKKDLVKLHTIHGRKKSDLYIIEGVRCCNEALQHLDSDSIVAVILRDIPDNLHDISNLCYYQVAEDTF